MAVPKSFFKAKELVVRPYTEDDIPAILEVYRQNEDFLSLGPVATASLEMVRNDIVQSAEHGGFFCVIGDKQGRVIGVMDFAPHRGDSETAFLALLMISAPFRRKGYGVTIMDTFKKYLVKTYNSKTLKAGVMVNNPLAIKFWERVGFTIDRTPELMPDGTTVFRMSKNIRE